jgi:hypothetical protein
MNNLRMDWALENHGLSGPTKPLDAWSCGVCGADRCGPLHRLCKLLQATRNKLQSVAGSSASGADPIRVVELPAGTTRAALAELTAAAVQSALEERGLLDPASPPSRSLSRGTRRGRSARQQPQPRTRGRQSDRRERVC